jgi:hypothetical protein
MFEIKVGVMDFRRMEVPFLKNLEQHKGIQLTMRCQVLEGISIEMGFVWCPGGECAFGNLLDKFTQVCVGQLVQSHGNGAADRNSG